MQSFQQATPTSLSGFNVEKSQNFKYNIEMETLFGIQKKITPSLKHYLH